MILLPAIDLYQKKAVRLLRGDYEKMTVYSDDPLSVAQDFQSQGAHWIHMVDLEGARDGGTPNLDVVSSVAAETGLRVEVGGGVRDMQTAERYFRSGVSRVILGTAAVTDESFLREAAARFGEKIAVGADVRDGAIAIRGWREQAACTLEEFLSRMQSIGIRTVICTDISRDGAMRGSNLALYGKLSGEYEMDIVASGGISSLEDVKALRALDLYGAIIGKAYSTGAINLREALEAAK